MRQLATSRDMASSCVSFLVRSACDRESLLGSDPRAAACTCSRAAPDVCPLGSSSLRTAGAAGSWTLAPPATALSAVGPGWLVQSAVATCLEAVRSVFQASDSVSSQHPGVLPSPSAELVVQLRAAEVQREGFQAPCLLRQVADSHRERVWQVIGVGTACSLRMQHQCWTPVHAQRASAPNALGTACVCTSPGLPAFALAVCVACRLDASNGQSCVIRRASELCRRLCATQGSPEGGIALDHPPHIHHKKLFAAVPAAALCQLHTYVLHAVPQTSEVSSSAGPVCSMHAARCSEHKHLVWREPGALLVAAACYWTLCAQPAIAEVITGEGDTGLPRLQLTASTGL